MINKRMVVFRMVLICKKRDSPLFKIPIVVIHSPFFTISKWVCTYECVSVHSIMYIHSCIRIHIPIKMKVSLKIKNYYCKTKQYMCIYILYFNIFIYYIYLTSSPLSFPILFLQNRRCHNY